MAKEKGTEKVSAKKSKTDKPSETSVSKSKGKKKSGEGNKFKAAFKSISGFFKDCKNEIKKIVWPTVNSTFKNMGIVLVVILIIGLFVFGLDTALVSLLGQVMSIAG